MRDTWMRGQGHATVFVRAALMLFLIPAGTSQPTCSPLYDTSVSHFTGPTFLPDFEDSPTVTNIALVVPVSAPAIVEEVMIDITHTCDADLRISLLSPAGTQVILANQIGNCGDNFQSTIFRDDADAPINAAGNSPPFAGTYRPMSGTLSSWASEDRAGTWTLRVEDLAGGDEGTLSSFEISFQDAYVVSDPPCPWVHVGGSEQFYSGTEGLYHQDCDDLSSFSPNPSGQLFPVYVQMSTGSLLFHDALGSQEWVIARNNTPVLSLLQRILIPQASNTQWVQVDSGAAAPGVRVSCLATEADLPPLQAAKEAFSWGGNFYGELARSVHVQTSLPTGTPARITPALSGLRSISTGCNHGLAVLQGGGVRAWGANAHGELGNAVGLGVPTANPTPTAVSLGISRLGAGVAAGGDFSVVLADDGGLFTFGSNLYGQLGRSGNAGIDTWNPTPTRIPTGASTLPAFRLVSAGRHHAFAVSQSNTVYTWGRNDQGQLCRSTAGQSYHSTPSLLGLGDVAHVSLGRYHSVILAGDVAGGSGAVWCCGSNLYGQCASVGASGVADVVNGIGQIGAQEFGGEGAVAVAAGEYHTLVQVVSGAVWGFGRNTYGQLAHVRGYGMGVSVAMPVCVSCGLPPGHQVLSFDGGRAHTLIVAQVGAHVHVYAAGSNQYGQLAGSSSGGFTLVEVTAQWGCAAAPAPDPGFGCKTDEMQPLSVHAGCDESFLVVERPKCPTGSYSDLEDGVYPCVVCAGGGYGTASGTNECALCDVGKFSYEGSTFCNDCRAGTATVGGGNSLEGCLAVCGAGTFGSSVSSNPSVGPGLEPCQECPLDSYSGVNGQTACTPCPPNTGTSIRNGTSVSVCRAYCPNGTLSSDGLVPLGTQQCEPCPGGQYQNSTRQSSCISCPTGKFTSGGGPKISCQDCPVGTFSREQGTAECTDCDYGSFQATQGSLSCNACPPLTSTPVRRSAQLSDCIPVASIDLAFGQNTHGTLGVPNRTEITAHALVYANDVGNPGRTFGNSLLVQVSAGFTHNIARTSGGRVWVWGENAYGELGVSPQGKEDRCFSREAAGEFACMYHPSGSPAPLEIRIDGSAPGMVGSVYAGRHVSFLLTTHRYPKVFSWGLNKYGQLGRPDNVNTDLENHVPAEITLFAQYDVIVCVSGGWHHALALTKKGKVYAWGRAELGQLGVTLSGTSTYTHVPQEVPKILFDDWPAAQVSAGGLHSLVRTPNGDVWSFGCNTQGQLGVPDSFKVYGAGVSTPQKVPLPRKAVDCSAGGRHSLVLLEDGAVFGYGSNYYGQLASVTYAGVSTFTPFLLASDTLLGGFLNGSRVSAGASHSVVSRQKSVVLFGSNRYGQLGKQETAGLSAENPLPAELSLCSLVPGACDAPNQFQQKHAVTFAQAGGTHTLVRLLLSCDRGEHAAMGTCVRCARGKYSGSIGAVSCTPCPAGSFAGGEGQTSCAQCETGKYNPLSGASACTPCSLGGTTRFSGSRDSGDCMPTCQLGQYGDVNVVSGKGMEPCFPCAYGKVSLEAGNTACYTCVKGKYFVDPRTCASCGPGSSTAGPGAVSVGECKAVCAPGHVGPFGLIPCSPCPKDQIPNANQTLCVPCGAGNGTAGVGRSVCKRTCPPGHVSSDGLCVNQNPCSGCVPCAGGTFANGGLNCTACPRGKYTPPGQSMDQCLLCEAGSYRASEFGTFCALCERGAAASTSGASYCEACQPGSFSSSTGASVCVWCTVVNGSGWISERMTGSTGCVRCSAGTYAVSQSAVCRQCAPGTYSRGPTNACTLCDVGTYTQALGSTACINCANGTTTLAPGSDSSAKCVWFTDSGMVLGPNRQADELSDATVSFKSRIYIATGDKITLGLPSFSSETLSPVLSGFSSSKFTASWRNATEDTPFEHVILLLKSPIMAGDSIRFTVTSVRVPLYGNAKDNPSLTLSVKSYGSVNVPLQSSTAIGSFLGTATVSYDLTGQRLSISFLPSFAMAHLDEVALLLPYFISTSSTLIGTGHDAFAFDQMSYFDSTSQRLTFRVGYNQALAKGQSVSVSFGPLSVDTSMATHAELLHSMVMISTNAAAGPVPSTVVKVCRFAEHGATRCCRGSVSCLWEDAATQQN